VKTTKLPCGTYERKRKLKDNPSSRAGKKGEKLSGRPGDRKGTGGPCGPFPSKIPLRRREIHRRAFAEDVKFNKGKDGNDKDMQDAEEIGEVPSSGGEEGRFSGIKRRTPERRPPVNGHLRERGRFSDTADMKKKEAGRVFVSNVVPSKGKGNATPFVGCRSAGVGGFLCTCNHGGERQKTTEGGSKTRQGIGA